MDTLDALVAIVDLSVARDAPATPEGSAQMNRIDSLNAIVRDYSLAESDIYLFELMRSLKLDPTRPMPT